MSVILMMAFLPGGSGITYLLFLPSCLYHMWPLFLHPLPKEKKYTQKVAAAREKFRKDLADLDGRLLSMQKIEKSIRREKDPDDSECLRRAREKDSRLGERRPLDPIFSASALAQEPLPSTYKIQITEKDDRIEEFSAEYKVVDDICQKYSSLDEMPQCARLSVTGSIGIAGSRSETIDFARSLLARY